jgi:hypothetical protein
MSIRFKPNHIALLSMNKSKIGISIQLCLLGNFVALVAEFGNNTAGYAHSFSPNSLSTFISLVHAADVELSLANSNFPANITLALDHSKNAVKLMNYAYRSDDEIIDDIDFVRKYNNAMSSQNETIHALVVANIVDRILSEYGEALDLQYDLTNMSNMNMAMQDMSNSDSFIFPSFPAHITNESIPIIERGDNNNNSNSNTTNTSIVNFDNYASAQKLSEVVLQIFNDQLSPLAGSSNNTANKAAIAMIDKDLIELKDLLNNRASAQDVMMLVHGRLHPSLQLAYGLKLKQ